MVSKTEPFHQASQLARPVAVSLIVGAVSWVMWKMYNRRMLFRRLRRLGLPMPKWSPASGHLELLPPLLNELPKDAAQEYPFTKLAQDFPESDNMYCLDLWPFFKPMMVISSPQMAIQVCQDHDLPKPDILVPFFAPIAGGEGMFVSNGPEWKRHRSLFNPGFSANAILDHTPTIVQEAEVYVDILREHAKKEDMVFLDQLTCWYMMDVVGAVSINTRLNSQRGYNALAMAMRSQMDWHIRAEELNPFKRYNPIRYYKFWSNSNAMNNYISTHLDKAYEEWKTSGAPSTKSKSKSVMDLAMAGYLSGKALQEHLDPQFKKWAITQMREFLFVGHDSTAATIVYSLYLLSKHPESLAKIRAEHDKVFSSDVSAAPGLLKEQPKLTNQLPYTVAVIKEVLRLFPPASGLRDGVPGVSIRDSNGNQYPTEGLSIWILHQSLHRNPRYWPEATKFLPERWLVEKDHPLYPTQGAWRPFEFGPRNCIGQTLVMLDIKIALVMLLREFDITDAYEEFDRARGLKGIKNVNGERAYQVSQGADHPADGFPCRVSFRKA